MACISPSSASDWNIPYYKLTRPSTLQLSLRLTPPEPGYESVLNLQNVAAISGELHYDSSIFHSPRIEPGPDWPNRQATGMEVEPGVYRFTAYTKPIERIWYGFDLAYISFQYDIPALMESDPPGGTLELSFHDMKAAAYKIDNQITRKYLEPITFAPYELDLETFIQAGTSDWSFYQ